MHALFDLFYSSCNVLIRTLRCRLHDCRFVSRGSGRWQHFFPFLYLLNFYLMRFSSRGRERCLHLWIRRYQNQNFIPNVLSWNSRNERLWVVWFILRAHFSISRNDRTRSKSLEQWWERSPLTNVARVWFRSGATCGLRCHVLLVLALLRGFSSLPKNQDLQIPIRAACRSRMKTS